jgi:hypothetical protein
LTTASGVRRPRQCAGCKGHNPDCGRGLPLAAYHRLRHSGIGHRQRAVCSCARVRVHQPSFDFLEQVMSIFSTILSKIFPSSHPAVQGGASTPASATPAAAAPAPTAAEGATAAAQPAAEPVDVEAILNNLASQHSETLNWRTSIVDLMKLLGLDSSLTARKELAEELNYSGDTNDSASMNVWLHKQVMTKLAQNGGKVPDDLKD